MNNNTLRAVPRITEITGGPGPLEKLLQEDLLYPVFQPIVNLETASIHAHEALIRGPHGTSLHTPDSLLRAAADEHMGYEFENACVRAALQTWGQLKVPGRLFINISAGVLTQLMALRGRDAVLQLIHQLGVIPSLLVLEITEHERVENMDHFAEVIAEVRTAGVSIALDDFGDGHSSLRLWSQIKPEVVKIDKYFTKNLNENGDRLKTIQALQQIAAIFGSELVAEGIENQEDLRVLRDLGITYGQGYFLGHPDRNPLKYLGPTPQRILRDRQVAFLPEVNPCNTGWSPSQPHLSTYLHQPQHQPQA